MNNTKSLTEVLRGYTQAQAEAAARHFQWSDGDVQPLDEQAAVEQISGTGVRLLEVLQGFEEICRATGDELPPAITKSQALFDQALWHPAEPATLQAAEALVTLLDEHARSLADPLLPIQVMEAALALNRAARARARLAGWTLEATDAGDTSGASGDGLHAA